MNKSIKRTSKFLALVVIAGALSFFSLGIDKVKAADERGDYRTQANGEWNNSDTWQKYNGSAWVAATESPTISNAGIITILDGHTVTISEATTSDQVVVSSGGKIDIPVGVTWTIANNRGVDLTVNGTVASLGTIVGSDRVTITVNGTYSVVAVTGSNINTTVNNGGIFNVSGPAALGTTLTINPGGTLNVSGSGAVTLASISNMTTMGGMINISDSGSLFLTRYNSGPLLLILSGGLINMTDNASITITGSANAYMTIGSGGTLNMGPNAIIKGKGQFHQNGGTLNLSAGVVGNIQAEGNQLYQDGSSQPDIVRQQQIREYRHQESGLQQKISALSDTADVFIPMPILFGIGISDIWENFGVLRPSGLTHKGEDIMAIKGTPIVSPTPAVVTLVTTDPAASEGNAVYTANPGGETFVYYHLDRIGEGVVAGLVLERGSLIGYVGNTGNAAGGAAHLHFEIHNSSGIVTDPFLRLKEEFLIQEKILYLSVILTQSSDSVALAQFLVTNFRSVFLGALATNIVLPLPIIDALASMPATLAPIVYLSAVNSTIPSDFTFINNLGVGTVLQDVVYLKIMLAREGCISGVLNTTLFASKTLAGVKCLQNKYKAEISTFAGYNIAVTGFVGGGTRAELNVLLLK